jgi:acyl-CoA dehydrogenase
MEIMETSLFLIFLIGIAYYCIGFKIWLPLLGVLLCIDTFFSHPPYLAWLFFAAALLFIFPAFRLSYITPRVLAWFCKALPPIHATERIALEAGEVVWEKELFCGKPDWKVLSSMPASSLTSEETAFLENQVEMLCQQLDDWTSVQTDKNLSPAVWAYLKKEGFFGLQIPTAYGGRGFSVWAHAYIITKIASRSVSAGITVMVPNALGPAEFLQHYGTDAQKSYYLPRLARGEEIPAFALTGVEAGSDATAIPDTGIVCRGIYQGKEVIGLRLNWNKRYITLAPIATVLGLAFKMYDPDHLLGEEEELGITVCLLPTDLVGVEIGARHAPAGLAFLNGPTQGKDVFISLDCIIGGVEMAGQGWHMLMDCLARGRGISLPALSVASAQLCYRMTGAYALLREQFHHPIGSFEGVADILGRIGGLTYLSEATRHLTLSALAQGIKPALGAAITKYHLTEMMRVIVNDAMDVHGGHAIQLGPHNYLGLLYQSLPVSITVEGANILTRNLIIFGQGALRCHPFVHAEMNAAALEDKTEGVQRFDALFCRHLGYSFHQAARVFIYGLTGGLNIAGPKNTKQLTRMSAALAFISDISFLRLGKDLKRKEAISARLGDVLSFLYLASAVLKYHQDQGKPAEDAVFVQWTLAHCLYHIQKAFEGALFNFSPLWLGRLLYRFIFPWGSAYRPPADTLTRDIARRMMQPSAQRDRLTQFCYVGKNEEEATGRIELAFQAEAKMREICALHHIPLEGSLIAQLHRLKKKEVFSVSELASLERFLYLRDKALAVDDSNSL